ncbi:MAG: ATP-binding cassette domain-containing protein [Bacilli bacterium]|nr:ATP-binding cassette domain-containing protein [Bacilli bacterium]
MISLLDTYEGNIYIEGNNKKLEENRNNYISNIFQNLNLINNYTVYENIKLTTVLNNNGQYKIKKLIKKLDLLPYIDTKVSKLSGGQRQKVAIIRAILSDKPIIIADEITSNLDTESSKKVLKLLKKISKDKLIIIVTHKNYEIEKYITRKITLQNGTITKDEIKTKPEYKKIKIKNNKTPLIDKIKLSIKNTFNVIPKFILLLFILCFISLIYTLEYLSIKQNTLDGYSNIYHDTSLKRIIIKKNTPLNDNDYNILKNNIDIDYIVKHDILIDYKVKIKINDNIQEVYIKLDNNIKNNEAILKTSIYENIEEIDIYNTKLKVYKKYQNTIDNYLYVNDYILNKIVREVYKEYTNYYIKSNNDIKYINLSKEIINSNPNINITIDNLYYKENISLKNYYIDKDTLYINENDYNKLFKNDIYQSSIYIKNYNDIKNTLSKLTNLGYDYILPSDTLINSNIKSILNIILTILMIIILLILFLISYFIIKIILKKYSMYYKTLRLYGFNMKEVKYHILIELFIINTLSFILLIIFKNLYDTNNLLNIKDYILIYISLNILIYLISNKYSKYLFKKSIIETLKENI